MKKGGLVWTWWDSGAMGASQMYGRVVKAGPKSYTVLWESGFRNRLEQGDERVKKCEKETQVEAAMEAMKRHG